MSSHRTRTPSTNRLIIGITAALAAAVVLIMRGLADRPSLGMIEVPAVAIGVGFLAAELWVIHLPSRRGAHSFSLTEIPLAVGLMSLSPIHLLVTLLVATTVAMGFIRRLGLLKIGFNLANSAGGMAIAAYIVHRWIPTGADPQQLWPVLFVALFAESLMTSITVAGVIALMNPGRGAKAVGIEVSTSTTWTLLGAYLGTLLATALIVDTLLATMSLGLVAAGVASSRLYGKLHLRHVELESVHSVARAINAADGVEELTDVFLRETAEQMRVRHAWVAYASSKEAGGWNWHHFDRGTSTRSTISIDQPTVVCADTLLESLEASLPSGPRAVDGPAVGNPIRSGDRIVGRAVVADRTGPDPLGDNDQRFLATVSGLFGSALTRALAEQSLEAEIREKQRIIQSKDQLITAVSHELRTPLTGILGFAETLRTEPDLEDPAVREMLALIASQSLDLSNIVEDLLTAARHDLNNLAVHLVPTELDELVTATLASMNGRLPLTPTLELRRVAGWADPPRLRQILRNLLNNAAKYGGEHIRIRIIDQEVGPAIQIADDGLGIGGIDPEAIFQPYISAHPESAGQPGSVGLGLTISRRLARMMGGDLQYRRRDGWTTFTVQLRHPPDGSTGSAVHEGKAAASNPSSSIRAR